MIIEGVFISCNWSTKHWRCVHFIYWEYETLKVCSFPVIGVRNTCVTYIF